MPITLEMPDTELSNDAPWSDDRQQNTDAMLAADLLEQGDAELPGTDGGPTDVGGDLESTLDSTLAAADAEAAVSNGKPAKKKRTRKPKAAPEQPEQTAQENQPAEAQAKESTPATDVRPVDSLAVAEQLAKVEMSRSTRAMEIAKLESYCLECFMAIAETEAVIESQKEQLKRLREESATLAVKLRSLRNSEQWQPSLPLESPPASPPAAAVDGSTGQATNVPAEPDMKTSVAAPADQTVTTTAAANGDAPFVWPENMAVVELGLPPKLMDKLSEGRITTLGDVENCRQGNAKWPKGIGAAKVELINGAMSKWIAKNRIQQPADKQPDSSATTAPAAQPVDVRPSRRPAAASKTPSTPDDPPEQSDAEYAAEITARATAINDGSASCLDRKNPNGDGAWQSGYEAYGRVIDGADGKLTDCPYIAGIERDDWIRGFLSARIVDDYEPFVAAAAQPAPAELSSLDDI